MSLSIIISDKTFRSCVWIERSFLIENLAESITTTILKGFRSGDLCGNHRNPFICLVKNRPDIKVDWMTQREPPQTEPLYRDSGPAYSRERHILAVAYGVDIFASVLAVFGITFWYIGNINPVEIGILILAPLTTPLMDTLTFVGTIGTWVSAIAHYNMGYYA